MDIRKWLLKKLNKDNYMTELFLENAKLKAQNDQLESDILIMRKGLSWGMSCTPAEFARSVRKMQADEERNYFNNRDLEKINENLAYQIRELEKQLNEKCD